MAAEPPPELGSPYHLSPSCGEPERLRRRACCSAGALEGPGRGPRPVHRNSLGTWPPALSPVRGALLHSPHLGLRVGGGGGARARPILCKSGLASSFFPQLGLLELRAPLGQAAFGVSLPEWSSCQEVGLIPRFLVFCSSPCHNLEVALPSKTHQGLGSTPRCSLNSLPIPHILALET